MHIANDMICWFLKEDGPLKISSLLQEMPAANIYRLFRDLLFLGWRPVPIDNDG